MTDTETLKSRLVAIDTLYVEKTNQQPFRAAGLKLTSESSDQWSVAIWKTIEGADCWMYAYGDTPEEAMDAMVEQINAMPSVEEQWLSEFQRDLAALIDKGNEFGIEGKWLNPIVETARELAENVIEHKG